MTNEAAYSVGGDASYSPALATKNLEQAFEHTNAAWFPADRELLDRLRSKLEQGTFSSAIELLEEAKSDFSLYLYCLKELRARVTADHNGAQGRHGGRNPSLPTMLKQIDPRLMTDIFQFDGSISTHRFTDIEPFQTLRLREMALSASTVELLGEHFELDTRVCYTTALMRQLGLTLIAWNYPSVYRRTISNLASLSRSSATDLDTMLHHTLGFSPTMLGLRFAREWGLAEDITSAIDAAPGTKQVLRHLDQRSPHLNSQDLVVHLCAVGEAFARANIPQQYPTARDDWEHAHAVIARHLGADGMRRIYDRAREWSPPALGSIPDPQEITRTHPEEAQLQSDSYAARLFERNVFLRACPSHVRRALVPVYQGMQPEDVPHHVLRDLIHRVLPEVGFDSACIFMLDPTAAVLTPVLKTGSAAFIKLKPVPLEKAGLDSNPIGAAFHRQTPVQEEGMLLRGGSKLFICGALGDARPVGVLYLEVSLKTDQAFREHALLSFRAVAHCLNDLLHLA
ncbi:MAG: HDOD domain-containing protein [Bdellovibrionales bacterium]|nr:HDOD domain-containing protein [Bdellovibrionales bacterium]